MSEPMLSCREVEVAYGQVQILFGGEVATNVAFIGGAPFFAGLNQINAVIPQNVVGGTNVPVASSTGNAFTDLVDISIGI